MYKVAAIFIGVLTLFLSFNAPAFAGGDMPSCRKAVIVYLDVSGSMKRDNAISIKTGKSISLMQSMGELFEVLFNRETGIVEADDYFQLKGFYGKVGPLISKSTRFGEVRREVLRKSASMQKHGMCAAETARFVGGLKYKTSFAEVLKDMDRTGDQLLRGGGGYSQYIYLLFTDGLDDSGISGLENSFRDCILAGYGDREQSKTKILLIGLPGDNSLKPSEINVQNYFRDYLRAFVFHCGQSLDTNRILHTVKEQIQPAIEVVDIENPVPHSKLDKINIPILLANDSCSDLKLKSVSWEILSYPEDQGNPVKLKGVEVLEKDFFIKAGGGEDNLRKYTLSIADHLPAGKSVISVRPETVHGVHGRLKKVERRVEPVILLRNTSIEFSKERDRFIVRTKLTSAFDRELKLDSLRVHLFRLVDDGKRHEVFTNRVAESAHRSISFSSTDASYDDYFFEVDIPELSGGNYVAEVYAQTVSGGKGNTVPVRKEISPYASIENIVIAPVDSGEKYEVELVLSNHGDRPLSVDAIRIVPVKKAAGKGKIGRDWEEVGSELIDIEPLSLAAGEKKSVSIQLRAKQLRTGVNTHLLFVAENFRERGVSPAYVYELPKEKKSSFLGGLLVVLALFGAGYFVIKNFVMEN